MERELLLNTAGRNFRIQLGQDELSLQIAMGYMDYRGSRFDKRQEGDFIDLLLMRHANFFAGADQYLNLHGVDGALRRFRSSRVWRVLTNQMQQPQIPLNDMKIRKETSKLEKLVLLKKIA